VNSSQVFRREALTATGAHGV